MRADEVDHGFAVKVEVGFVDEEHGVRRAPREFEQFCARVATEPDGLLGLAMAMTLVRGVMAASRRSKGNCRSSAAWTATTRASVAEA